MSNLTGDSLPAHEEHERRFLVDDLSILEDAPYQEIEQAYLWAEEGYAVRVRLKRRPGNPEHTQAFLTLKGPRDAANPYMRYEVEQLIEPAHAEAIVRTAQYVVLKKRYAVISGEMAFEVDVFQGKNEGLVIAEFEGSPQAVAQMERPWFASEEVTQDERYSNDRLAICPYSEW